MLYSFLHRFTEPIIEQDVFESLYKRRPLKRAPVKSQRSFRSDLRSYPAPNRPKSEKITPKSAFDFSRAPAVPDPKSAARTSRPQAAARMISASSTLNKLTSPTHKPPKYLFGSLDYPGSAIVKPKSQSPPIIATNDDHDGQDRFRTITLKDVRQSFREKYLPTDDVAATSGRGNKTRLPIWFVNVKTDAEPTKTQTMESTTSPQSATDRDAYRSLTYMEFNNETPAEFPNSSSSKVTVNRKNTFKVLQPIATETDQRPVIDGDGYQPRPRIIQRRNTFKVLDPMKAPSPSSTVIVDPQTATRGYYLNRYRKLIEPTASSAQRQLPNQPERLAKTIPVGIATPYNSHNDRSPSPPPRMLRRNRSPQIEQSPMRPHSFSTDTYTRKLSSQQTQRQSASPASSGARSPTPGKISFDAMRKPADAPTDAGKTNLGFDRFYDPNYFVQKNQNLFGPLATAHFRTVNVGVETRSRSTSAGRARAEKKHWY